MSWSTKNVLFFLYRNVEVTEAVETKRSNADPFPKTVSSVSCQFLQSNFKIFLSTDEEFANRMPHKPAV